MTCRRCGGWGRLVIIPPGRESWTSVRPCPECCCNRCGTRLPNPDGRWYCRDCRDQISVLDEFFISDL